MGNFFVPRRIAGKWEALILSGLMLTGLLLSGCAAGPATTTETTIAVGANQRLVSGRILAIAGNEISLAVQDAAATASPDETAAVTDSAGTAPSPSGSFRPLRNSGSSTTTHSAGGVSGSSAPAPNFSARETLQLTIPVGTKVVTAKGTITTFSRLAAGDSVSVLLEQSGSGEVVVGVYLLENQRSQTTSEVTSHESANN